MTSESSGSPGPQRGVLHSIWDRFKGMMQAATEGDPNDREQMANTIDLPGSSPPPSEEEGLVPPPPPPASPGVPAAIPVAPVPPPEQAEQIVDRDPWTVDREEERSTAQGSRSTNPPAYCPLATTSCPYTPGEPFCGDCGLVLSADAATTTSTTSEAGPMRIKQRYELGALLGERQGVARYRGRDLGVTLTENIPVVILRQAIPEDAPETLEPEPILPDTVPPTSVGSEDEILPSFDEPPAPITEVLPLRPRWPNVSWEKYLLDSVEHPGLPRILDSFVQDGCEYLVEEVPAGQSLWDAWDDPSMTNAQRFGLLVQVAQIMQILHRLGAMLETIRPDMVVVGTTGQVRITDLSELLSLPVPPDAPIRGSWYTAAELLSAPSEADARAALYSFGSMLYALHVGRELSEIDFDQKRVGHPKPFIPQFPDIHPAFGRLMHKTFCKQVEARFPSDEAGREDATGFSELIRTLKVCGRALDHVRLEIGCWTTTGMIRTGNEDAYAILHSCESRQDDLSECAMLLLCDGMGGYEAGEVAAAMAMGHLRTFMLQQAPFKGLAGASVFATPLPSGAESNAGPPLNVDEAKKLIRAALKEANKQVFTSSRSGVGKRGMGCTAEAVYIDGRNLVVGHVGDSRTYHLSEGRLIQVTRDQTLVNRLVELGTLTAEEAEHHPRRNELQQAIGGQPDVEPGVYHSIVKPGDFIVVCSDGVSNHVKDSILKQFLQSEAFSAELAARRLVNLTNIEGATDNATVIVVRAV